MSAEGYGQVLIGRIRQVKKKSLCRPNEFPMTLGRDFAGQVVAVGANVLKAKDLNVGDAVMGVVAPFESGCHAELVIVPRTQVKPPLPGVRYMPHIKILMYRVSYGNLHFIVHG